MPEEVKKQRLQALLAAQTEASLAGNLPFIGTRQQILVEGISNHEEKRAARSILPTADPAPESLAQLTGRTMCDRIVVFEAPLRLIGRLVDVSITAASAWSMSGVVADGLADAVPLELPAGMLVDPPLHSITLPAGAGSNRAAGS